MFSKSSKQFKFSPFFRLLSTASPQFPMTEGRLRVPQTFKLERCIPGQNPTGKPGALLRPSDEMSVADFLRQLAEHPKYRAENQWTQKDLQRALYQFFQHKVDTVSNLRQISKRVWNEMDLVPGIADAIRTVILGDDNTEYSTEFRLPHPGALDLCTSPAYKAEDLGKPLPNSPHATSVCLPTWKQVIGYEEGEPEVIAKLQLGYPRFFIHPFVTRLIKVCEKEFANKGEESWVFPSLQVANRCMTYLHSKIGFGAMARVRINQVRDSEIHAITFPAGSRFHVQQFWQHFGDIVSSRQAIAALEGPQEPVSTLMAEEARRLVKERIGKQTGEASENVYLYPSGMSAISQSLQMVQAITPGAKSVQMGFPYLDVLKIQTVFGPGNHFYPEGCDGDLEALEKLLQKEKLSSVLCEFPGNPLLTTPNLPRLSHLLREHGVPLIIDDTISSFANIKAFPYADVVVSSLTKWFSGTGDVMAGSLVLNRHSRHYDKCREFQSAHYEDILYGADTQVLEINCRDFPERMKKTNETAKQLTDFLRKHPKVEKIYFPQAGDIPAHILKGSGFGGLFSLLLKNPTQTSSVFFDSLTVSKGPSLGCRFTLACPYTMLAHYDEMDWAESVGISRWLIRVSVGLEEPSDLIKRFSLALDQI